MKLGFLIPHKITIRASANMGFIVKIGCGEFVAPDSAVLLGNLKQYLHDPEKWEKDYNKLPSGNDSRPDVVKDRSEPGMETATE